MQTMRFKNWLDLPFPDAPPEQELKNVDMACVYQLEQTLEHIPQLYRDGPWLVGGSLRRLMAGEQLTTDYDIMFKDPAQFDMFCGQMRELGSETVDETPHQITFRHEGKDIQAIRAEFSPTLVQTLNKFDFTICQFGFDGTNLVWGDTAMDDLRAERLVFTQTNDHISTLRRAFKYANQGFFFDHEQITKLLKSVTQQQEDLVKADAKWTEVAADPANPFRIGRIDSTRVQSYGV